MKKKILAFALVGMMSFPAVASAERNPYNELDVINTSGYNMSDICEMEGMSFDEFKKEYGLPEDMPEDTNETSAFLQISLENFAKSTYANADEIVDYINDALGIEATKDIKLSEIEEKLNSISLKTYIENFTGVEYDEFLQLYELREDFDPETPFGEVETKLDRIQLEESGLLNYFNRDSFLVMLKGRYLDFDVEPQIVNDRMMVPLRAIFEELGVAINWDDETQTIFATKDQTVVVMQVGQNVLYVNGEKIELDAPSMIVGDRTLVPIRAIANAFGNEVFYNANTKTVVIH